MLAHAYVPVPPYQPGLSYSLIKYCKSSYRCLAKFSDTIPNKLLSDLILKKTLKLTRHPDKIQCKYNIVVKNFTPPRPNINPLIGVIELLFAY